MAPLEAYRVQKNSQGLSVNDCAAYPPACYCPLVKAFACLDDEPRDHLAECRRAEYVGDQLAQSADSLGGTFR
jgi:hypothetical protein